MLDVLLVDDEPLVLEGLKTMIDWEKYGFRICGEATDGSDAFALIQMRCPHVVVTDIHMPVLNGLQLIEQSRQLLHAPPKFVILSGYDDFQFVQTAMRYHVSSYMLKPIDDEEIDDLLQKLHKEFAEESKRDKGNLRGQELWLNRAVQRMLAGVCDERDISCVKRLLGVGDQEEIACMLVERTGRKIGESEMHAWKNDVQAWLMANFPGQLLHLLEDGIGKLVLIVRGKGGLPKRMAAGLLSNPSILSYGCPIAIYVSESRPGMEFVYQGSRREIDISEADLKSLLHEIDNGQADGIRHQVLELFSQFGEGRTPIESVKLLIESLKVELMKLVMDINADIHEFGPKLFSLDRVERFENLHQLESHVQDLCGYTASYMQEWRRLNTGNMIGQIINYVNKHYKRKLQLQQVAEQFHLNPVYLGQLFKKTTGITFNEYIHVKRIEEAMRLLKRPARSISDIAFSIGYEDPDYFVRKFKAITNCLPSSYKTKESAGPTKQSH